MRIFHYSGGDRLYVEESPKALHLHTYTIAIFVRAHKINGTICSVVGSYFCYCYCFLFFFIYSLRFSFFFFRRLFFITKRRYAVESTVITYYPATEIRRVKHIFRTKCRCHITRPFVSHLVVCRLCLSSIDIRSSIQPFRPTHAS